MIAPLAAKISRICGSESQSRRCLQFHEMQERITPLLYEEKRVSETYARSAVKRSGGLVALLGPAGERPTRAGYLLSVAYPQPIDLRGHF
jgi:hypothetical protein